MMRSRFITPVKSALCLFLLMAALPVSATDASLSDAQILHLLNRVSFGPSPGDIDMVRRMGLQAYIDQQLHPGMIQPSEDLNARLAQFPTINASIPDLMNSYFVREEDRKQMSEEERKEANKREYTIVSELRDAKILRAVMSPAQLQEVMTDFWFNHFNVFHSKGQDKIFIGSYERDAIRPYALGKFSDLLFATASHPAMLVYLDNVQNVNPDRFVMSNKKQGINENYAREIMELHTLGVNGGYTQQDVTTLAHILTGWGLSEGRDPVQRTSFFFDPKRHDFSNQVFLGTQIRGGGIEEVEYALNMLAHAPATAQHISYQLAQYFVADEPPKSLIDKMTATFMSTDGDIAAVLKTLFYAPEFWDPKYQQIKFKPPFRYLVSAMRAAHIAPEGGMQKLQGMLSQMGEPLYQCLTPNGYANTNDQWLNSDALLKRIGFAQMLAQFSDPNSVNLIENAEGQNWSPTTLDTVHKAEVKMQPALLLGSPEFVYY